MRKNLNIVLGCLFCGLCVALGAFGSHGLRETLSERQLEIFQTGIHYGFLHGIGLILYGIASKKAGVGVVGALFIVGILVFTGSLVVLAVTGLSWLGAVTPVGGVCFIAAWALFAFQAWKA